MPRRPSIADYADRLAKGSGLYRLTLIDWMDRREGRSLRWWPLLILIAMPLGWMLSADHATRLLNVLGAILLWGGFMAATWIRFFGPRLVGTLERPLDEREAMIRARASAASGRTITVLAIAACFYMGATGLLGWQRPNAMGWIFAAIILEGWAFTLPVLFASWMQGKTPADD